jgi:predicted RNA-binding Zn-ribbon protein involved in translation (DUF1610 family)
MNENDRVDRDLSQTTSKPTNPIQFKTKFIVIVIIILFLSSGFLFYINVPWIYYGALALGVFLLLIFLFLIMSITEGPAELFSSSSGGTQSSSEQKTVKNPSLERLFKAERRYKRSGDSTYGPSRPIRRVVPKKRTIKRPRPMKSKVEEESKPRPKKTTEIDMELVEETKPKPKPSRSSSRHKSSRIGSVPIEESISKERISLKNKTESQQKASKTKKVTTFLCPDCGGKELYYEAGLISGYKYHCKDCDYIGSLVIEKDFNLTD